MIKNTQKEEKMLQEVCQKIFDKKGFNILTIDVRGVSNITDYFIIAEGRIERHVQALANVVVDAFSEHKIKPIHIEGKQEGDWVAIDYGDIIVHILVPELRERYAIEQVWKDGKVVDIKYTVRPGVSEEDLFF